MSDNQFDFGPAAKQIESLKGAANGLASLDSNGLVPSSQLPGATQSVAGLMSAADKTKLDGIATGATANVVSDSLSDTSTTNALSAAKGKALNDSITALNTQITKQTTLATTNTSVVVSSPVNRVAKVAGLCVWNANMNLKATATTSTVIATLPSGYRPAVDVRFAGRRGSTVDMFTINTSGELMTLLNSANNGDWISFSVAYDV